MAIDWDEVRKREKERNIVNDLNSGGNTLNYMAEDISSQYESTKKVSDALRKQYATAVNNYSSLINSNADFIKSTYGEDTYAQMQNDFKEHSSYSNLLTDSFAGYEERKNELEESKKNARAVRRQALSQYYKTVYLSGKHYSEDDVKKALSNYTSAKNEIKEVKTKISNAKQIDKNNEEDERNQWYNKIVSNNAVSDLLSQAYNADSSLYAAGKQLENTSLDVQYQQNALGNNYASEQAYSSYKVKENALKKIDELGYDSKKLFDMYSKQKNMEETEKLVEKTKAFENEHPVLSNVLSVPGNLIGGVEGTKEKITNKLAGKENDPYSREQLLTNAVNAIREQSKENIRNDNADNFLGKEVKFGNVNLGTTGEMMYSAGMSAADNLMNMAAATVFTGGVGSALGVSSGLTAGAAGSGVKGVLGTLKNTSKAVEPVVLGLMSTNTYNNAYNENLINGMSDSEAGIRAAISSGIEVLTEKIGMDKMIEGIGGNLSQIVLGAVAEGGEEVLSNMLNRLVDVIADGDESELQLKLQEYLDTYGDKTVAYEHLLSDILSEDLQAGIVGSLSGAMMSGPSVAGYVSGKVNEHNVNKSIGQSIANNNNFFKLVDMGKNSDKIDIRELAEKAVNAKAKKTYPAIGKLANAMSEYYADSKQQDTHSAVESGVKQYLIGTGKTVEYADRIAPAVTDSLIDGKKSRNKEVNSLAEEINNNETSFAKQINNQISLIADDAEFKNMHLGSALVGEMSSLEDYAAQRGYSKLRSYYTNKDEIRNFTVDVDDEKVQVDSTKPISFKDGKVNVNTLSGNDIKPVPASDVLESISDNGKRNLFEAVINSTAAEQGMNTIIANYDGQTAANYASENAYVKDAELIYSYGRVYPNKSFNDALKVRGLPIGKNALLPEVAKNIFTAGQTDAMAQDKDKTQFEYKKSERKDKQGSFTDNAETDENTSNALKIESKALGIDIEAVSDENSDNGTYTPSLAKIVLNMSGNKRNWFSTNVHELVHFTRNYAPTAYQNLENRLIDWFISKNNLGSYENAIQAYMRTYSKDNANFTRAAAKEEITADSISALFSTKDGVKEFISYIADKYKQKAMEIFDTFEEWINNIITAINTMLKSDVLSPLQRSVLQMDEKQAASIRRQFLSALDEAVSNYRSYKTEQKNNTADGDVKNSKTLGKFADVDVNTKDELYYFFGNDVRLNNVSYTQTKVKNKLISDNFFSKNNRNIVVNADSNIIVEISPDGIDETLSYGKRYYKTPRFIKEAKIATIRSLPELIKYAEVKELNQINYHGKSARFLVLEHPARVDGKLYNVEIKIKKTTKNKFYIHNLTLIKETDTPDAEVADKSTSTAIMSSNQSLTQNVSQNNSNVNTKSSKDVDFSKALAGKEWKKFNTSIITEDDEGLRISDNSILVECENDSKYQYKYVIYDDFEDKPMITDVYAIGRINLNVEDDVASQCHNIAKYINDVKELGYDNEQIFRSILRTRLKGTSYILTRYNNQTKRFYVIGRGSVENGTNTFDKSERGRDTSKDRRFSRDVDFTYENFINKPDMPITVIDDKKDYRPGKAVRESVVNNALESALSVGRKDKSGNISVYVDDIDTDVLVSKKGLRHSLDRRLSIIAPVIENIGSILKKSIKINEMTPKFDVIEKSYVLIGIAKNNNNEPYVVSFVVNRASNEIMSIDILYAVNAKKEATALIEPELSSQSDVSLTASKISISDLLNYVNRYYPDVLPEDVLKHYGYESRPDGKLGESALYSKDVDFSQSEIESLKDENSTLRSENMYLATINEELKTGFKLTGGRVINPRLAKVVAERIKKTWNTTLSSDDIAERVRQISVRHQNDVDFNWNVLLAECKAIAQDVWDNRKNEITAEGKEILAEIRKTKVSLDYIQKSKIANYYGSYDVFRKKNFGSVLFSKDGVPIETQWLKWCEQFPDYFDASVSYELQPLVLEDIVESIKSAGNADYGFVENEAVTSMAYELADAYLDVPTRVKYDDKKQYEINKSRFEAKKALAKLKEQNRLEYENDIADVKEKLENKKDKNIAEYKARQRALQKRRDRRLKSEYKNRIKKKLYTIARIGATQNQKQHIPSAILDSVKQIIDAIELGYGGKTETEAFVNNMNNFANAFQSISNDDYYATLVETFDQVISAMMSNLNETLDNKTVKEMTADEMRQVNDILSVTLRAIRNINKAFVNSRNATISGLANDVSNELSEYNNGKTLKGLPGGYVYNSFKPLYFFRNLGSDTLTELYNNLRKGEDTWARTVYEAKKYINSIRSEYNYKEWDFKKPIKYTSEYGEELELSLQNVMSIYALSRREQGLQHLTEGGYVLKKSTDKTKKPSLYEKNDASVQHRLTVGDVHSIIAKLTTEQVEYVKALQSYLSNEMGAKGNEVSKELWDIELFNEKAYFPIKVWKEALGKQVQKKDEIQVSGKLKNASFTKKIVPNANMPVIIDDFDSVCAQHINDMASYHAFVLPLEDFQRVFGYKAKQDDEGMFMNPAVALKQAYGGKALEYIDTLVNTVNSKSVVISPVSTFGKLISNYKKAAVLANISVIVQQPTAIWRAMAYINPKYFAKTASGKILFKKYYDEAKQYAPVYIIKELGYFDTNMSKTAEDFLNQYDYQGLEKVKAFITDKTFRDDVFGYGASKADEATWAYIWLACKSEAKAKYSNLSEEEQLIKAGEKATEVITKTQVYDSVFSRSGFMRDSDRHGSMMSAFMAEPTVNMNMAYDAVVQLKRRKISKKQFTAIAASLVTQAIFNGLARNLVVALRDDDEDKTYLEKFFGNLPASILDGFNPVKSLILFKDIYSILQGYDVTRSDLDGIANAVAKIMYDFTHKDDIDPVDATIDIATSILAVFGAPYKNVYRDVKAFVTTVKTDKKLKKEESDKLSSVAVEEKVVDSILGGVPLRDLFMTLKKSDEYKYAHALAEDNDEKAKAIKEHWLEKNSDKTSDDFDNRMVTYLAENDKRIISAVSDRNSMKTSSYEKTVLEMIYEGYSDQIIYDAVDKIDKKVRSAAQDSIDGDTLEYDKKVNELLMLGYDKELLDEHIEKISELLNETSDSETVKGKYDADDLFNVWMTKGDTSSEYKSVYKDIIDTYVANGKTEERAEELAIDAINKRYKKVNDNFELSSMAYEQGNMQSYRNYINRISADGKYSQTEVAKMASGHETQNGTIWHLVDYAKAVYYGSYADTVYNELIASGVEEKSIRSSTTSYFRDKYKKATSQWQRQNIINKMYKTGLYNSSDINRYVNNWNE